MDKNELDNSTKRNIDSSVFILLECTTEGFEVQNDRWCTEKENCTVSAVSKGKNAVINALTMIYFCTVMYKADVQQEPVE